MNNSTECWINTQLGNICSIVYGKTLPKSNFEKDGYPVFGANGIIGCFHKYLYEHEHVLISCRGAYSGKINFSPPKVFITNNSLVLEISDELLITKKFLYYFLVFLDK